MTNWKKARERMVFQIAREKVAEWPLGEAEEGENPDFVICGKAERVGVEVTEVVRPADRARVNNRRVICERARALYGKRYDPTGLALSVAFFAKVADSKALRQEIAAELAAIIERNVSADIAVPVKANLRCGEHFKSLAIASICARIGCQGFRMVAGRPLKLGGSPG